MDDRRGFERYLTKIQSTIDDVREKQAPNILKAAGMIAASLEQGGILHVLGASRSQLLVQEILPSWLLAVRRLVHSHQLT